MTLFRKTKQLKASQASKGVNSYWFIYFYNKGDNNYDWLGVVGWCEGAG